MNFLKLSSFVALTMLVAGSCVKQNFSAPPDTSAVDPNLPVNTTLRDFSNQALSMGAGQYRVLGDTTIYGIVTADDRSGNFYKQIVIQDTTGGITIGIDKTNIYADYPIGRKVYIKCKGLLLVNYKGLPEITASVSSTGSTTGIPSSLVNNYVIKASYPNAVVAKTVSVNDLFANQNSYYNTLVRISCTQFASSNAGVEYAAPTSSGSISTSLTVEGHDSATCNLVATMTLYNSAYATFQPAITPTGNGYITAIFSNYNSAVQLLLRDTSDVRMTGTRCP